MGDRFQAGLQATRNTGVDCRIYSQGGDPLFPATGQVIEFKGRHNTPYGDPCVTAVSTSKSLGAVAGNFSMTVQSPHNPGHESFIDRIQSEDWIDIAFVVNGVRQHFFRGVVETVRETLTTSASGVESHTVYISGREFGAVLEKTSIWFNVFTEGLPFAYALKILEARNVAGQPNQAVKKLLFGFLETLTGLGRADWALPAGMPGAGTQNSFADNLDFNDDDFDPAPERLAVSAQLMDPEGKSIWALVQEWSDPMFCDLILESALPAWMNIGNDAVEFDQTIMRATFRTKPFPTLQKGSGSLWWTLPLLEVPPQVISSRDVGRGALDRYNAFFTSPQLPPGMQRTLLKMPLWDPQAILRHGMRPLYVESNYVMLQQNEANYALQRETLRDWYCLNPYFLNGTIQLGAVYPTARVGTRFRILGGEESGNETYYVEQVSHNWSLMAGGRTSLGVTRGWTGSDDSYTAALAKVASGYSLANVPATPDAG